MSFGTPETFVQKVVYEAGGVGPDVSNSETPVPLPFVVTVTLDVNSYQTVDEAALDAAFSSLAVAIDSLSGFSCSLAGKSSDVYVFTPPA